MIPLPPLMLFDLSMACIWSEFCDDIFSPSVHIRFRGFFPLCFSYGFFLHLFIALAYMYHWDILTAFFLLDVSLVVHTIVCYSICNERSCYIHMPRSEFVSAHHHAKSFDHLGGCWYFYACMTSILPTRLPPRLLLALLSTFSY